MKRSVLAVLCALAAIVIIINAFIQSRTEVAPRKITLSDKEINKAREENRKLFERLK
jgi:hypothetical protein